MGARWPERVFSRSGPEPGGAGHARVLEDLLMLPRRSLIYYWRTNLAVVLGVAIAVSVLAGAALVGESVRASLRDLFLNRLGATRSLAIGAGFFREKLADSFPAACPLSAMEGLVFHD